MEEVETLKPKGKREGKLNWRYSFVAKDSLGRKQAPNPADSNKQNVETLYNSCKGKHAVKYAYSYAGMGYQKKRKRRSNGVDTSLKVTRHESEPTSGWSFFARKCVEPYIMGESK